MVYASQHPGRKSNPGLPRERRESYHLTTDDHRVMGAPSVLSLIKLLKTVSLAIPERVYP